MQCRGKFDQHEIIFGTISRNYRKTQNRKKGETPGETRKIANREIGKALCKTRGKLW